MRLRVVSTVLSSAFLTSGLSLANIISMGLRSGLYGGKKKRCALASRIKSRAGFPLLLPRLSRITISSAAWPIKRPDPDRFAADVPKRSAVARTVMPSFSAAAMRVRKPGERGRTIIASLQSSNDLESYNQTRGNLIRIPSSPVRLQRSEKHAVAEQSCLCLRSGCCQVQTDIMGHLPDDRYGLSDRIAQIPAGFSTARHCFCPPLAMSECIDRRSCAPIGDNAQTDLLTGHRRRRTMPASRQYGGRLSDPEAFPRGRGR